MAANILRDPEFGDIKIVRSHLARNVSLKIDANGQMRISMPPLCPMLMARRLVDQSRDAIRQKRQNTKPQTILCHGDQIGKIHKLQISHSFTPTSRVTKDKLHVVLPHDMDYQSPEAQQFIQKAVLKSLRFQSRKFLEKRLRHLADLHGFEFQRVRYSNASSRWGSCSTSGTISLNIWLMQLPFELIEYVLVHELCHTIHHNHSEQFWAAVQQILPKYKLHRRALKSYSPSM